MTTRFITVGRLMRDYRIPWPQAEAIIREQTGRTRHHPGAMLCYLGGFFMGVIGVPLLVPHERALGLGLRLACLGVMLVGILLPRVLARQAILDAAQACRTHAR